jgi:hypothetical protein
MAQVTTGDFVRRKAQRMDVSAGVSHLSWPPRRQRGSLRLPPPVSVSRLFLTDIVESVEDVAAVLEGVFLGTLQPLGIDHARESLPVPLSVQSCRDSHVTPIETVVFLPAVDKRTSACTAIVQQTPERTFMGLLKA